MPAATRNLLMAVLLSLALPQAARAQRLSDDTLRAVIARPVWLHLRDGREVQVQILSIEPSQLVISLLSSGEVRILPRDSVMAMRELFEPPIAPSVVPPRRRHFAFELSLLPGLALDLDAGLFHGFANVGILMPLATNNGVIPASFGFGLGIPVLPSQPGLKLDIFAHLSIIGDLRENSDSGFHTGNWLGFGLGIGLHNTWSNGLTLGFTVPIVGYAVHFGSTYYARDIDLATALSNYFVASAEALPLFYLGYRL